MSINKVEGIILRTTLFKEQDYIIDIYTPNKGKVTCKGKRGQKLQSNNGSAFQVGNHVMLGLYSKQENEGMPIVTTADIVNQFSKTKMDFTKLVLSQYVMEVIGKNTEDGDDNLPLYKLLVSSLLYIEKNPVTMHWRTTFEYFLLTRLGFQPETRRCMITGKELHEAAIFDMELGGIVSPEYDKKGYRLSKIDLLYLEKLKSVRPHDPNIPVPKKVKKLIAHMTNVYGYGPFNTFKFYGIKD